MGSPEAASEVRPLPSFQLPPFPTNWHWKKMDKGAKCENMRHLEVTQPGGQGGTSTPQPKLKAQGRVRQDHSALHTLFLPSPVSEASWGQTQLHSPLALAKEDRLQAWPELPGQGPGVPAWA